MLNVFIALTIAMAASLVFFTMPMDAPEWAVQLVGACMVAPMFFLVLHGLTT